MDLSVKREPLPGDPPTPATPAGTDGPAWWQRAIDATGHALDTVPGWTWLTLAVALFAALLVLRHRLDKALTTRPAKTGDRLGGLFVAAVVLAALLWGCILAASATNLLGFGRDTLGWHDGHEWLMIGGVDGIAVVFAVLMFAAARAGRPTHRAYRIVWSSTLLSAGIGVWQGWDSAHSLAAALVLGYFALASMGVLHELLDLFRATTERKAPRVRPPFGLRWVTYFPNTVCAALAWENHPPLPLPADASDEQLAWYGSVRHAVRHLETVRRAKRIAAYRVDRHAGGLPPVGWARILPWLRVRQLGAALAALRETSAAELTRVRDDAAAELARVVEQAAAELAAVEETAAARLTAAEEHAADLTRQLADMTELFEQATADTRAAEERATAAEGRALAAEQTARTATAAADTARLDAARAVAAAEQTATLATGRADRVTADLDAAREMVGQLRAQAASATAAAEQAAAEAADLRRLLTDEQAARRADVDRLTREHEQAVSSLLTATKSTSRRPRREQPARPPATEQPAGEQPADQAAGEQPAGSGREPSSPPWSEQQLEAFRLRDADRTQWSWPKLADRYGVASSTVRRWFANRTKHQQQHPATPTLSIDPPTTPTTAVNGTPVPVPTS